MGFSILQETGRPVEIRDEGVTLIGNVESIDFTGDGISGTIIGSDITENVPQGGHTIKDDGGALTQRANLNFIGMTVADNAGTNSTDVTGSSGGAWGSITGTLSAQSDLNTALSGKQTTALASAKILVGSVSNVASAVDMSSDITIDNVGATTIGANKVTYQKTYNGNQLSIISALRFLSGN